METRDISLLPRHHNIYSGPRIEKGESSPGQSQPAAPVSSSEPNKKSDEENHNSQVNLSPAQQNMLLKLKSRDSEVRTHEQAHVAAGGGYVNGGIRYVYQKGPDGKLYAIGGEVSIDVSPIPNDPEATAKKMEQVQKAALAPSSPSPQDRKVAAKANLIKNKALQELVLMQKEARAKDEFERAKNYGEEKKESGSLFTIQV